jgi:hypothetical protein
MVPQGADADSNAALLPEKAGANGPGWEYESGGSSEVEELGRARPAGCGCGVQRGPRAGSYTWTKHSRQMLCARRSGGLADQKRGGFKSV